MVASGYLAPERLEPNTVLIIRRASTQPQCLVLRADERLSHDVIELRAEDATLGTSSPQCIKSDAACAIVEAAPEAARRIPPGESADRW
jgi:hypothetical protein